MKINGNTPINAELFASIRKMLRDDDRVPEYGFTKVAYLKIPRDGLYDARCEVGYVPIERCNFEPLDGEVGVLGCIHIFTQSAENYISIQIVDRQFKRNRWNETTLPKKRQHAESANNKDDTGDFILGVTAAAVAMAGAME